MKMSYFHTLLAEVCTGVAPEVNAKALAWGKQYENDARTLFEFTSGVNITESPIIYRDESMRTACSPDGLCSDGNGLELKCPFTSRDFMKFRLGGFEAIKSAYMAQVQYSMWVTRKDAWYFANYDPRMKREGLHYVVIERNEKYMASFDEMVPEFIEKMDEVNRPDFPGECFICELRLPDHCFRWKHNKLFLLLPEEYGPAFPAIVDCYTSPPT